MGIYGKQEQEAIKRFKETEEKYREYIHKPIYTRNGILDQIKPVKPITLRVEDLYEDVGSDFWWLLDVLLEDRVDLHDRIKKYKKEHKDPGS